MDVKVAFSSNLTPDANITEEIEDNVALSGVETGKDGISIMTLKVNSINAGDSLKIEMFPSTQYSLGENKTEDVWMLAEVITSNKNSYISNKLTRTVTDYSTNLKLEQQGEYEDGKSNKCFYR